MDYYSTESQNFRIIQINPFCCCCCCRCCYSKPTLSHLLECELGGEVYSELSLLKQICKKHSFFSFTAACRQGYQSSSTIVALNRLSKKAGKSLEQYKLCHWDCKKKAIISNWTRQIRQSTST